MITCPCGLRYVGMTGRQVKIRIGEHKSTIRCKRTSTRLTKHFLEANHMANELKWVVIEQVATDRQGVDRILFEKEQRWVHRLGTSSGGLNDEIPWGQFY